MVHVLSGETNQLLRKLQFHLKQAFEVPPDESGKDAAIMSFDLLVMLSGVRHFMTLRHYDACRKLQCNAKW